MSLGEEALPFCWDNEICGDKDAKYFDFAEEDDDDDYDPDL